MPGYGDDSELFDDEWSADDRDAPQECDLTDEDDDETPTVPCPNCGRPVPDFSDRCHHCGEWIVQTAGPPAHRRPWFVTIVVVAILIAATWWICGRRMGC